MRARRSILVAVLALAAIPASAQGAATPVSVDNGSGDLDIVATAAEVNNITVSRTATQYVVTDAGPGATTADAADCSVAAAVVSCNAAIVNRIDMRLSDLDDRGQADASVTSPDDFDPFVTIQGQAGNDTLTGSPNATNGLFGHDQSGDAPGSDTLTGGSLIDQLSGSDGTDVLTGGGGFNQYVPGLGDDTVVGGPDADQIEMQAGPDGADSISGGAGQFDNVGYRDRSGDVTIDTNNVADDGEPGEGDNVMDDIESGQTGRGNDTLRFGPTENNVSAGNGNDLIDTGAGDDNAFADRGNDSVSTGDGNDTIGTGNGSDSADAGPGDDIFSGDDSQDSVPDPDIYAGGPGTDTVNRTFSQDPVTLTLDGVPDDGVAGEGDNYGTDIENANGGLRNDTLGGNDSDNELAGNGGEDTLTGGRGADELFGGESGYEQGGQNRGGGSEVVDGADTLSGGPGIDTIEGAGGPDTVRSRDDGPDEVSCGSSPDTLFGDSFDSVASDCDRASLGVEFASKRAPVDGGKVVVEARCPQIEAGGCDAEFSLLVNRKKIARGNQEIDAGDERKVKLKPTKAGRDRLDGRGTLKAVAEAAMTDTAGDEVTSERKVNVAR